MKQRFLSLIGWSSSEDLAIGGPFYLLLLVVMIAAYVIVLINDPSMRQPGPLALFTGLMVAHGGLRLWGLRLVQHKRRWLVVYFLLQGGLVFAIGYLAQLEGLILAFYLALVGESAGMLWPDRRAIALAASFFVLLLLLNVSVIWGMDVLAGILPVLGLMLAFVLIYVVLYIRQVQAREDAQALLEELEAAHGQLRQYAAQVEELTISQERQRMARELHDTLAQGLAGLILQLEAADSYLERENGAQARAVVQQTMQRARTTLQEARRAIQALRPIALEQGNLVDALGHEVDQFSATTGIRATFEVSGEFPVVPPETALDILRIVQEALSNVGRHARAKHTLVRLARAHEMVQVVVQDDGLGFDPSEGLDRPGCFGLAGMRERAERIGGTLQVESERGKGTSVVLSVERSNGGEG
jgi:NarL family two-component system sensor histidine kinase YdfH